MAYLSNPIRNEAEEFIRDEIGRVGPDGLDKASIVRLYVARGASKTRVHEWIKALIHEAKNSLPDPLEAEVAQAEAMIKAAERAKILNSLPSAAEIRGLQQEAAAAVRPHRREPEPPGLNGPRPDAGYQQPVARTEQTVNGTGAPVVFLPESNVGTVMVRLERAIQTVEHCITYSYGENGKMRNPRMALAAADSLRRCLETAVRLHEAVDNIQTLQRFMDELMAALRKASPEVAADAVERLRGVTARWAE